ncbi:MAG: tRNA (adenosine(37)-N6)-threonylcarbamoyltransferase complex dimerization subunit type 1 TsaB [Candidatus Omnitrophica bacterium]|nr:tRNA (adenosine(37)-N6)-threonylcarbamoyltransferase complex dimerization subunit type 1 TsaB [Candidatus Omnitrophota bacterium]MBD3269828.1 tRNA (adenosine(37)-N6)-threonylcarbamoyltransferase complex dimerization subunit type 1 TsaB [Candidatus Omnitrophota bacterium]
MIFLIIDSSSLNTSFCISRNTEILYSSERKHPNGASKLAAGLDKAFRKLSIGFDDFDAFILGKGPGSFTGLRISFSVVKALVLAKKIPVILLNSFFSCAYPFRKKYDKIKVVADARRGKIYMSSFVSKNGILREKQKPGIFSLEEILSCRDHDLYVSYDGGLRKNILNTCKKINFYHRDVYPKAKYLLEAAGDYYRRAKFSSLSTMEPMYLHPRTCQVRGSKK